jgi:hypothetical protein
MRTEQLIQAIAADSTRTAPVATVLPVAVLVTALAVAAVFLPLIGVRPDIGGAVMHGPVLLKQAFPLLIVLAAGAAALRMACPGRTIGRWGQALALVPAVLVLAVAYELLTQPPAAWMPAMMGQSSGHCLAFIGIMSVPLLAASLWALRRGASTRPALSGALAGLLSGGAAATVYAVHCTEDSPLVYSLWYVLAMVGAAGAGWLVGRRLLRW